MIETIWQEFGWGAVDEPDPQAVEWGRSDSLDPDNVGDIADEGLGHRG